MSCCPSPGVLLRRDTSKDAELLVLRHENAVLRRQIAGPVRYEPADRFWFAALSGLIPRRRWCEVFPVTPGTLLAWHRRFIAAKWDYSARRARTGRPPTQAAPKKQILQLAHENPEWGHRRIQSEQPRLGHQIAASTVWEFLHAAGIEQALNLAADLGMRLESLLILLRDRDGKYGRTFDAVFQAEEIEIPHKPDTPTAPGNRRQVAAAVVRKDGWSSVRATRSASLAAVP